MASLVLLLSELLKHHDAEFGFISSSSSSTSSCFSGGPTAAAAGGGVSCATAKRVSGKTLRSGVGGYRREEDLVENEAELRVCVEFV
ncbi:hypothetical protein L1987_05382 [Smallanthus sonchifolius]|uniref:Uncharacterized protein n=1 Tax=Smallanthus sonchifolius TaxID=185202 RepID=A0ACB9JV76_9ASTR|nr:hypothetical protein L1987_05382 [Smallanthus sonchifolius]